jgi:hypothetical protein
VRLALTPRSVPFLQQPSKYLKTQSSSRSLIWHTLRIWDGCRTQNAFGIRGGFEVRILVAALVFVTFSAAAVPVQAAEKEDAQAVGAGVLAPRPMTASYASQPKRPAILPALYVTLGAMQAWDAYATNVALKAGAREANPAVAPFAGNTGALIGAKAAATVGTIFFAERLWKKNKVAAVVMLAAINGATAAVSMHNMRNAKVASGRH